MRITCNISFVIYCFIFLIACESSVEQEVEVPREAFSYDLIQSKIFNTSCALCGCHASESDGYFKQHHLVLSQDQSYDNLFNVSPTNDRAQRDGLKRVVPGDPENSFLLTKMNCSLDLAEMEYGNIMPLGGQPISEGRLAYLTSWIAEGAPRDGLIDADPRLLDDSKPLCDDLFVGLAPPDPATGFQLVVRPFVIAPNFEREIFVFTEVGNEDPVYINRFEMKMRSNSHHFLVNSFSSEIPEHLMPQVGKVRDVRNADGTLSDTTMEQIEYHIYTVASQAPELDYTFPPGVALKIPADHKLDINVHYVNKTNEPILGECYLNLYMADSTQVAHEARPIFFNNFDIELPPKEKTIVQRDYVSDHPMKLFMLTSHSHKHGERFDILISGGEQDGEVIYTSTDWQHPLVKTFDPPIDLKAGEGLIMRVTYNNTTDHTIRFGLTSDDEMGIIYGYYY